jgi:hypothetical protein
VAGEQVVRSRSAEAVAALCERLPAWLVDASACVLPSLQEARVATAVSLTLGKNDAGAAPAAGGPDRLGRAPPALRLTGSGRVATSRTRASPIARAHTCTRTRAMHAHARRHTHSHTYSGAPTTTHTDRH